MDGSTTLGFGLISPKLGLAVPLVVAGAAGWLTTQGLGRMLPKLGFAGVDATSGFTVSASAPAAVEPVVAAPVGAVADAASAGAVGAAVAPAGCFTTLGFGLMLPKLGLVAALVDADAAD